MVTQSAIFKSCEELVDACALSEYTPELCTYGIHMMDRRAYRMILKPGSRSVSIRWKLSKAVWYTGYPVRPVHICRSTFEYVRVGSSRESPTPCRLSLDIYSTRFVA